MEDVVSPQRYEVEVTAQQAERERKRGKGVEDRNDETMEGTEELRACPHH